MLLPRAIPAFNDNYIWILTHPESKNALVVDPGDAKHVLDILTKEKLRLTTIFVTHHHFDHSGGALELMQKTNAHVYGPHSNLFSGASPLHDNEVIHIEEMGLSFIAYEIPGHTLDHIALVSEHPIQGHPILFCGDTLFTGGCGRVFEGTPQQMLNSLQRLKQLDPATLVYCGHEYTEANLKFAALVEPDNAALLQRIEAVKLKRNRREPTVPSSLAEELSTNPFLRTDLDSLRQAAEKYAAKKLNTEVEVFATIRKWKNDLS